MKKFSLFIDGSVNPQLKTGYGACLFVPDDDLPYLSEAFIIDHIKVKRFESTTSTRLEIETFLWALSEIESLPGMEDRNFKITIYSDSQTITGLPGRRIRLEQRYYRSKGKDTELANARLYRRFFHETDRFRCQFIKVAGHSKMSDKDAIDRIFRFVDRACRKALRRGIKT